MKKENSLLLISELISLIIRERKGLKRLYKINFWRKIIKSEIKNYENENT